MTKAVLIALLSITLCTITASAQTTKAGDPNASFTIADSSSFTGKYKYEGLPFEYIEVSVREGRLYFEGGEYNGFLVPMKDKKDAFDVNGVALFTFLRNNENKVAELRVDYEGQTYLGKKEQKKS